MAPKRQSLESWINEARNDKEKEEPCVQLALIQKQGMKDEPIWAVKLGPDKQKWTDADLAKVFQNKAETTVQDLPGTHTFNVLAFYGSNPEPQSKRIISVYIATDEGQATENPTPNGALQQTMRHKEDFFRSMLQHQQALNRQSIDMVNAMGQSFIQMSRAAAEERQASANLMRENREAFEIIKDMMMKRITDEREHEMKRLAYIRNTEMQRKVLELAPALVNTVTGTEVFPQSKADTVLIEQIASAFDKMDEGTLMTMSAVIPAELMGPLMNRFMKWKQDKADEVKRIESLNPPITDPEAEAAGDVQPSRLSAATREQGEEFVDPIDVEGSTR
jgi:hypothetical protein